MLDLRVWAECRPTHEDELQSAKLIADLDAIEEREVKQGSFILFYRHFGLPFPPIVRFLRQSILHIAFNPSRLRNSCEKG